MHEFEGILHNLPRITDLNALVILIRRLWAASQADFFSIKSKADLAEIPKTVPTQPTWSAVVDVVLQQLQEYMLHPSVAGQGYAPLVRIFGAFRHSFRQGIRVSLLNGKKQDLAAEWTIRPEQPFHLLQPKP